MGRARIDDAAGRAAVAEWQRASEGINAGSGAGGSGGAGGGAGAGAAAPLGRELKALAVRFTLQELAERAPGNTLEVRVPPFGAVQCIEGPRHTRGTPPNVIETDAETWLRLATGSLSWADALASGSVHASGQRADLAAELPLA